MGVIDWFKRGVGELMIARPDEAKAFVVWKHPDPTIPMKSQLTVMADEQAIFMRDGKVVGTLGPGRHTLDSSNIPFLSNLVDSFTGGRLFITEVFFVTTRENTGVRFGGPIGNVEDPARRLWRKPVRTVERERHGGLRHARFTGDVGDPRSARGPLLHGLLAAAVRARPGRSWRWFSVRPGRARRTG